jgi:Isoprenylcysteine carboxyl methyltransferase (ICMT) family
VDGPQRRLGPRWRYDPLARRAAVCPRRRIAAVAGLRAGPAVQRAVEIQPGHTLALSGVYEVIRHPSYLGLLVNLLGWVLAFRSWVGVLLTALLIQPPARAYNAEERLLRSEFSAECEAFRARTSRLIPGLYQGDSRSVVVAFDASSGTCASAPQPIIYSSLPS